jgi:cytoskeletal protein CcmA (bactofilin family)
MDTFKRLRSHRLLILIALAALLMLLVVPVHAADTRGGENVVIGRSEVINDDLYVAGNTVTIDGTINGDLVASASLVTVNGTVNGDVVAAGQAVVINGTVSDDVRAAGQAVVLTPGARVAGDLVVGALSLENQVGSVVQGDLLVGAYQALLAGAIGQRVRGDLDRMELRGTVGGDVDVAVSGNPSPVSAVQFSPAGIVPIPGVQPNLTIAESAQIGGKLIYRSIAEATISSTARITGGTAFELLPSSSAAPAAPSAVWLGYARRLAGLLLAGLLLLWLAPTWTRRLADRLEAQPLPSLGWGAVAFVACIAALLGILILTIILAIIFGSLTLGGLVAMIVSLGLLASAGMVIGYIAFSAYLAEGIVAYMAGRWLLRRTLPAWAEQPVVPLVVGLVLYVLLRAIPWIGWLVGVLVVLLALGTLWAWGRATFSRARPTPISGLQPA